jgi:hypothetical protein
MAPADLDYNPYAPAALGPCATYRLRDEAPAYWNDELNFWALNRFADVQHAPGWTYSSAGGIALKAGVGPTPSR